MVVFGAVMLVALLPLAGLVAIISLETLTGVEFRLRSLAGLATLALGSLAMAAVVGYVFLRTLLLPLQELIARTAEIEAGRADAFRAIESGGTREVAALGERFFVLAKRLSQRSSYLTLFTTHVSHELKTPLTSIQGAAELLGEEGGDMKEDQRRRFLKNIKDDAERLATLSSRLRDLAKAEMGATDGDSFLLPIAKTCAAQAGVVLVTDAEDLRLPISEANAQIVWQQLMSNAEQHGAKRVRFAVEQRAAQIAIRIWDDGKAISRANRDKIFDPFFTTRRAEGGTGMGLGIARAMVESHGGKLTLSDDDEFKFVLTWPVAG